MENFASSVFRDYQATIELLEKFVPSFIVLIAAAIASLIAWRQWRTANYRLCFDLFERRYEVYLSTKFLVEQVAIHGEITVGDLADYQRDIRGAEFLFRGEARQYFQKIIELCFKAQQAQRRQDRTDDEILRARLIDEEEDIWTWLQTQGPELEKMMKPYLDLSKVGV